MSFEDEHGLGQKKKGVLKKYTGKGGAYKSAVNSVANFVTGGPRGKTRKAKEADFLSESLKKARRLVNNGAGNSPAEDLNLEAYQGQNKRLKNARGWMTSVSGNGTSPDDSWPTSVSDRRKEIQDAARNFLRKK